MPISPGRTQGDDFNVRCGVGVKAGPPPYEVVVADQQKAMVGIGKGLMVALEAETVLGIQPARYWV